MIPGAFAYHRPTSVKEAVGLLAQWGDEGRALAGGHSLIPMMKLRLATPAHLVDSRQPLSVKYRANHGPSLLPEGLSPISLGRNGVFTAGSLDVAQVEGRRHRSADLVKLVCVFAPAFGLD